MLIIKTIKDINSQIVKIKSEGKKVGFVPTMGALHAGHISLLNRSNKENEVSVCSIFVNPTQFNDPKDFEKYPISLDNDVEKLKKANCDILFLPSVAEMYPKGYANADKIDFGYLSETLEGEFRPGHFEGMAQIVEKLLLAVEPDRLYMGQKDYQQALICSQLIRTRKMKCKLVMCPVKREKDGLAMSSRNVRLDAHSRKVAVEISRVLKDLKRDISGLKRQAAKSSGRAAESPLLQGVAVLEDAAKKKLEVFPEFKIEYFAIRDSKTLKPIGALNPDKDAIALVAAWVGGVRLIDNMLV